MYICNWGGLVGWGLVGVCVCAVEVFIPRGCSTFFWTTKNVRAQPPMPTGHTSRRARVSAQLNKSICKFVLSAQAGAKRAGQGAKARGWKRNLPMAPSAAAEATMSAMKAKATLRSCIFALLYWLGGGEQGLEGEGGRGEDACLNAAAAELLPRRPGARYHPNPSISGLL